jgi:hypothetical protein
MSDRIKFLLSMHQLTFYIILTAYIDAVLPLDRFQHHQQQQLQQQPFCQGLTFRFRTYRGSSLVYVCTRRRLAFRIHLSHRADPRI